MKKLLATFFAVLSIVAICAFVGCANVKVTKTQINEETCYAFTAHSSVVEITDTTTVADYIVALKDKGELNYEGYVGDYGLYISSVNGLKESFAEDYSSGSYWSFYLDFNTYENTIYASDTKTCEYKGKTYYFASYGFSGVPCLEGHGYILAYVTESWS